MRAGKAILLVEGRDDAVVCSNVMICHGVPKCCTVEAKHEGVEAVLKALPIYLEDSSYSRVGVIVDADEDIARRWDALRHTLQNLGYQPIPAAPAPDGTVLFAPGEDRPIAGIWIMPNNRIPGILEDFVRFLIPAGDPLIAYAETCVDGIDEKARQFPAVQRSKALIHTWLAWQQEPGAPLGLAITKRFVDATREDGRKLADWCRRLFLEEPVTEAAAPEGI